MQQCPDVMLKSLMPSATEDMLTLIMPQVKTSSVTVKKQYKWDKE